MKLYDPTGKNGIMQDVWFLTRSTSASYPMLDIVRNVNESYKDVGSKIWEVADGWEFDDSNYTNLPIATTNFINNQADYSVPFGLERLHRVEALQGTGSNQWLVIPELDWADVPVGMKQQWNVPGFPVFYKAVGQSIVFYPTPVSGAAGVTLSAGLMLYFERDILLYASNQSMSSSIVASAGGWAVQPGFAAPFHRILSLAAAVDYEEDENRKADFIAQKTALEQGMVRFYSKRNLNYQTQMKPWGRKRWRRFL